MPLKSDLMLGKRAVAQEVLSQANLQVILEEQRHLEGQGEYRPIGEFLVSMLTIERDVLERLRGDLEREACAQLATHVGRQLIAEKLTNDVALRSALRGFKRDPGARPSALLHYLSTMGGLADNAAAVTVAQVDALTDSYLAIVGYGNLIVAREDEEQRLRIGFQRGMVDEGKVFFALWCRMREVGTGQERLVLALGDGSLEQVDAIRRRHLNDRGGSGAAPASKPASSTASGDVPRVALSAAKPPSSPLPIPAKVAGATTKSVAAPVVPSPPPIAEPLGSIDDSSEDLQVPDLEVPRFEASSAEWITFDPPADGSIATVILPVSVSLTEVLDAPAIVPESSVSGTPPVVPSGRDVFNGENEKDTFRESGARGAAPSPRPAEPRPAAPRPEVRATPPRPSATRAEERAPSPRPDDRRPSPAPQSTAPQSQARSPRRETTRKNRVRRKDSGRSIDPMWLAGGGLFFAALVLLAVVIAMRDGPHPTIPPVRPGGGSGSGSDGGSSAGSHADPVPELLVRHTQARHQIEQQLSAGQFEEARRISAEFARAIEEAGLTGEVWDDRRFELEQLISSREMDRYNQLVTQFETAITEQHLDVAATALADLTKIAPETQRDQLKVLEERLREARRAGGS